MHCFSARPLVAFFLTTIGLAQTAHAADSWQSSIITENRRYAPTRFATYYNSQHLAVDRRGLPHVVYVETTGVSDTVYYARKMGPRWQRETVYVMPHSGRIVSGISGYALALDRRDQPHVYLYTSDYAETGPIFEERWAYRDGRKWQMRTIRRSVKEQGGAAMHDPHLAVDRFGNLHVTAYVHALGPTAHRAHHRYYDGSSFHIEPFPRPGGKFDSGPSNLFVDRQNVVHFVYDSKEALHRGKADPGYPDSSMVYITWKDGRWSPPDLIRGRVGPDPNDTDYFVLSNGIGVDRRGGIHVAYAISKRGKGDPADVYYAYGRRGTWREEHVARVPAPEEGSIRVPVLGPTIDAQGNPHFAFGMPLGTLDRTMYAFRQDGEWKQEPIDGTLEGFGLHAGTGVHVLTSFRYDVTYHWRP